MRPLVPTAALPPIPGVRLDGVLGRGGFATVYSGTQVSLERPVAVKVDSRALDDPRNRRRFLREVQASSRISGHPHVVSLIDTGVLEDGRPYLVMERCDGGNLADMIDQGPIPASDAVALIEAAASALGAAHSAGVLHRDVKPGNILLDSYGSPRLSDFGIAAIQREGYDIHAATAAKIYNKPVSEVTRDERTKAKRANFGIIYGITVFGLADRLNIERAEAKQLIDGYFKMFPQVQQYMEQAKETARVNGYVETFFHRRRYLPDINSSNATVRAIAERTAKIG